MENNKDNADSIVYDEEDEDNFNAMDDVIAKQEDIRDIDMLNAVVIVKNPVASSPGIETDEISDDEMQNAYTST